MSGWESESELHGPAFEPPPSPLPRLLMFGAMSLAALCAVGRAGGRLSEGDGSVRGSGA